MSLNGPNPGLGDLEKGDARALTARCSKRIATRWQACLFLTDADLLLGTQIGCRICLLIRHLFIHGFIPSTLDSSYMPAGIVLGVRRKTKVAETRAVF